MFSMDLSNILCWNCRGLWNSNMRNRMWELIKKHQPQIVFLVETRADEERVSQFFK